ncbi:nitroreductase family protein [Paenibacillus motobuensis]|uniref:nitroreductase family protein n=1 Tax=Paenibacillus TaxID=44249 RepID=UPI00203FEF6C|nr:MULTISPECIES: nitroreductase family protein [Paenibacillus]MCM3039474.1 nitroreductase family protein [Paenibacillus lutimineralis]MCM3646578.1 nitroreductase family protein [Paenibacillus motobuensis]
MSNVQTIVNEISAEVQATRVSEYPVSPLFLNRWSTRAYSTREVSNQDLYTVLDAAHWAPSSYNDQPWRFIVAKTKEQRSVFHQFINEFNLTWVSTAPVLIVVASDKLRDNGDPNGAHAFDAGAAWALMAIQATMLGMVTHAMGGIDRNKARQMLNIPDNFEIHAVIALGYHGDKSLLPEAVQQREVPNGRRPLNELVYEGKIE